ncbi:MAG: pectinacetylesterase family protein [Myxococcales bacterium]|nr:pectinacetylesterase family protein [Myxococcales bacterium]
MMPVLLWVGVACRPGATDPVELPTSSNTEERQPYDCDSLQSLLQATSADAADCEEADAALRAKFVDPHGEAPPADGLGGDLSFLYLPPCRDGTEDCAPADELRCLDGTRPGLYVDAAVQGRCSTGADVCIDDGDCADDGRCERNDWLFYVQGGPSCFDGRSCYLDFVSGPNRDMSTSPAPGLPGPSATVERTSDDGVLGRHIDNPFRSYNRVRLHKCTYDRYGGDRTVAQTNPATGDEVTLYFHGRRQWEAAFRTFARASGPVALPDGRVLDDLARAEHLALVGFSGGARGLAHMADDLVERVLTDDVSGLGLTADIGVVLDGGFQPMLESEVFFAPTGLPPLTWPPAFTCDEGCQLQDPDGPDLQASIYDHFRGPGQLPPGAAGLVPGYSMRDFLQEEATTIPEEYAGQGLQLDASCLQAHPDEPGPCHDSVHVITNHLATPVFLRMSLRDERHLGAAPGYSADDGYAWAAADLRSRIWLQAHDYLTAFADPVHGSELATCADPTFRAADGSCDPIPEARTPALYVPDRTEHMGLGRNWGLNVGNLAMSLRRCDADGVHPAEVSPVQAVHRWLHEGQQVQALEGLWREEAGRVRYWAASCP